MATEREEKAMRCVVRWSCCFRCRPIVYKCEVNELFDFWMPAHDENNDVIDFVQFDKWHQGLQQTSRIQHESLNWKRKKSRTREPNRPIETERMMYFIQTSALDVTWIRLQLEANSSLNVTKYNNTGETCGLFCYSFFFCFCVKNFSEMWRQNKRNDKFSSLFFHLFGQSLKTHLFRRVNEVKSNCDFDSVIIIFESKVLITIQFFFPRDCTTASFFSSQNGIFEVEFNRVSACMHNARAHDVSFNGDAAMAIKRPISACFFSCWWILFSIYFVSNLKNGLH